MDGLQITKRALLLASTWTYSSRLHNNHYHAAQAHRAITTARLNAHDLQISWQTFALVNRAIERRRFLNKIREL